MKITLTGNPLSTGQLYRSRGKIWYMTKAGKERKQQYIWEAKNQWRDEPMKGDLEIWVSLFFGDKRVRDWDNYHKITMDALEGIVLINDSQVMKSHVEKKYDKENPRTEIVIHSLTD